MRTVRILLLLLLLSLSLGGSFTCFYSSDDSFDPHTPTTRP